MAAAWKWSLDERKKPEINRSGINSRSAGQTTKITEPNRFRAEILNNADNAGISHDKKFEIKKSQNFVKSLKFSIFLIFLQIFGLKYFLENY